MNTELLRPITSKEVDTYHRDGVLLMKSEPDVCQLIKKQQPN